MKVVGFTVVRNGDKMGYPFIESLQSILSICDEFVVNLGPSEDRTQAMIEELNSDKIRIFHSEWVDTYNDGGKMVAVETSKVFQDIAPDADWCFYLQADEIIHEKYLPTIYNAMKESLAEEQVDGFLFDFVHFYNSFDYIGSGKTFYPLEIRIIRNNKKIYSYRDAQGFRKNENEKLKVKKIDASIYHYGWVRPPDKMIAKRRVMMRYYYTQNHIDQVLGNKKEYDYTIMDHYLVPFTETHPAVMKAKVDEMNWEFDINAYRSRPKLKDVFKRFLKKYFKLDFYYRNYILLD